MSTSCCSKPAGDWNPLFHMPAGFAKMTKGVASWGWETVPQKHMKGRVLRYTQAKVLGGGSSINAQLYTRGNAADYDTWVSADGCDGWSYRDILPYYKRAEDNQRFADDYHSYGGPLGVSMPVSALPICDAYIRPGRNWAFPIITISTDGSRPASASISSRSAIAAGRRHHSPISTRSEIARTLRSNLAPAFPASCWKETSHRR